MKTLFFVLGALFAVHSAALASQSASVVISAAQPTASVQLVDQKFEPIYGQEPYEATCSRQTLDHMEAVCHTESSQVCTGGQEVCGNVRGSVCRNNVCSDVIRRECHTTPRSCTDVPRRVCEDRAIYRTDYYSCTQYRKVMVGQRLVKTFNHAVEVILQDTAAIGNATLNIELNANESVVTPRLANSIKLGLLNYQISVLNSNDAGATAQFSRRVVITAGLAGKTVNKILSGQLVDLELGYDAAKFKLVNMADLMQNLNFSISIKRNRSIGGDTTLFNGIVPSAKLSLVAQGADILAIIAFEKLQIESLNSLKHDIRVSVKLNASGVLNTDEFKGALNKSIDGELVKVNPSF